MNWSPAVLTVDAITVVLLVLFALRGRSRGLVRTLSGILVLLFAFWGAGFLAQETSPYLSSKYVEPWIYESVMPSMEQDAASAPLTSEAEVTTSLGSALSDLGFTDSLLSAFFNDFVINLSDTVEEIVNNAAHSIGNKLTYALLFLIYFLILYVIFRIVAKIIHLLAKIPGINFFNRTFGFLLGLFFGYLFVSAIGYILSITGVLLTPELIAETTVLDFIMNFNPLSMMI